MKPNKKFNPFKLRSFLSKRFLKSFHRAAIKRTHSKPQFINLYTLKRIGRVTGIIYRSIG